MGMRVADKVESQDICFVQGGRYGDFVKERAGEALQAKPGVLVDTAGRTLGEHKGAIHYTVGQRKGLGVSSPEPLYVVAVDAQANRVVVGNRSELGHEAIDIREVNWVSCDPPEGPLDVEVKVRYRSVPVAGTVTPLGEGRAEVSFHEGRPTVSPGQSAVFYREETVLGGGVIDGRVGRDAGSETP